MPPRASKRVASTGTTATAAAPTSNRKRSRATAAAAAGEEAGSHAAPPAPSHSADERPTRRARGVATPASDAADGSGSGSARRSTRSASAGAGASIPAAAAAAAHPLGDPTRAPVCRCDVDALSLVFSFLNTSDFLCAIRVSRFWRSARLKRTAWPQLRLRSLVQSLRDDDYDDPSRRRLEVRLMHKAQSRLEQLLAGAAQATTTAPSGDAAAAASGGSESSATAASASGPSDSSASESSSASASATPPGSASASASASMWRHVTDIKLIVRDETFAGASSAMEAACDRALQQLAQLPVLSALNLHGCTASVPAVRAFYAAVADRLQALLLFGMGSSFGAVATQLPLLSNLRVLVVNAPPCAAALAQLTRLQYLHFCPSFSPTLDPTLARTLRWLSQQHRLRSLSVDSARTLDYGLFFQPPVLAAAAQPEPTAADAAAPTATSAVSSPHGVPATAAGSSAASAGPAVDWSRPCCLTDVSLSGRVLTKDVEWLGRLPHLRRLQIASAVPYASHAHHYVHGAPAAASAVAHVAVLSRLQQLRLCLHHDPNLRGQQDSMPLHWRHLQCAGQLRVLQLSSTVVVSLPAATLQRVLAACAAHIEELRLAARIRIRHADSAPATTALAASSGSVAAPPVPDASGIAAADATAATGSLAAALPPLGSWSVLVCCSRLRVLQMELQEHTGASGMLEALAQAPSFQSLELTLRGKQSDEWPAHGLVLPPQLLRCIARSRSWCSLHIHSDGGGGTVNLLRTGGGLARQMPAADADEATARRLRVYGHSATGRCVHSYGIRTNGDGQQEWQLL